jgi:outer membrane protein OmpA-like peptidoglycan-associated protein
MVSLDIGYRFFGTDDIKFTSFEPTAVKRRAEFEQESVTVGLRWQFEPVAAPAPALPPPLSPPPPPPLPPRAVCPTLEFAVYFEWDRSNLNSGAIDAIEAATEQARACNLSGAMVVGHADTSGSAPYNFGLSERRASVVRDALASRGVPPNLITVEARGETDLARPTRDGVREPLNRRAVVTISFR